jgi:hypothetical protein
MEKSLDVSNEEIKAKYDKVRPARYTRSIVCSPHGSKHASVSATAKA